MTVTGRFKPYAAYKYPGVEWFGAIPKHWSCLALSRVTRSRCDGPFGSGLKSEHYSDSGIRVIRLQNIGVAEFLDEDRAYIDEEYARALGDHSVLGGDLLVAGLGDDGHPVGRACVAPEWIEPAMVKADCFRFRLDQRQVLPRFAQYQLTAIAATTAGSLATGATRSRVSLTDMARRVVALPSADEQIAISHFLDQEMAKIDALVAKKERLIELLQEKRTALITRSVTRGLDSISPTRGADAEWFSAIPVRWTVSHLRRVIRQFVDYRGHTPQKTPSGVPLVTARNIKNHRIDFSASEEFIADELYDQWMVRGLPERGDVVVTTEAPLGESAQIEDPSVALAQRLILLKADKARVTNEYLQYHFAADSGHAELWSKATGSTALGIKASHLKATLIAIPPVAEQTEIARYLDRESAKIDALTARVRDALHRLTELRAALISAAVTGKIDVREEAT